jgi:ubiquitin-like 1-activating enzyme E1 B
MARSTSVQALLGPDTFEKVKNTKILVVGAGGIGCELRESSTRADERY